MDQGNAEPPILTEPARREANKTAIDNVIEIHRSLNKAELEELESRADRTFRELRFMIWVTFVLGLVLIGSSIILSAYRGESLQVLGLGSLGVADTVALLIFRPMNRLQQANGDFTEQLMIVASWIIAINLYLLAMKYEVPNTLQDAAKNIITASWKSSRDIQRISKEGAKGKKDANADQPKSQKLRRRGQPPALKSQIRPR